MRYLLLFILLTYHTSAVIAQINNEKSRIIAIQNLVAEKESNNVDAVTKKNGITEFWNFTHLNDSISTFKVWWYEDENLACEYYVVDNNKLIFAQEKELFIPYDHTPQRIWQCTYFLTDDVVFDHVSLGHGKTEDSSWNPQNILQQFIGRFQQKAQIKDVYNP